MGKNKPFDSFNEKQADIIIRLLDKYRLELSIENIIRKDGTYCLGPPWDFYEHLGMTAPQNLHYSSITVVSYGNHFELVVDPIYYYMFRSTDKRSTDKLRHHTNAHMPIFVVENKDTIKNNVGTQIAKYKQLITDKNAELKKVTNEINNTDINDSNYNTMVEPLVVSLTKITGELHHLTNTREYLVDILRAQTGKEELVKSKREYETKRNQNNTNIEDMTSANETMEKQIQKGSTEEALIEMKQIKQINEEQIEAHMQQNAEYNAMIDSINMELGKLNIQSSDTQSGGYRKKYLKYKQKYLLLKKK
jgi:hypothetical protein